MVSDCLLGTQEELIEEMANMVNVEEEDEEAEYSITWVSYLPNPLPQPFFLLNCALNGCFFSLAALFLYTVVSMSQHQQKLINI